MKLTISIRMDNAAFGEYPELETTRIIKRWIEDSVSDRWEIGNTYPLLDSDGNKVGSAKISK